MGSVHVPFFGMGGRTPLNKEGTMIRSERVYRLYLRIQRILGAPLWERTTCVGTVCDGFSYRLQITMRITEKQHFPVMLPEGRLIPLWADL